MMSHYSYEACKSSISSISPRTLAQLTSPNKGQDEAGRHRPPLDLRKVMAGRPTSRLVPTPPKGRGTGCKRRRWRGARSCPPTPPLPPPKMMERDETKQTKRRSCDGHMRTAILHGGFEDPAVPRRVQSARSGWRRRRRSPAHLL